jgi:hypothetical protein
MMTIYRMATLFLCTGSRATKLRAEALLDDHVRDGAEHDVQVVVEVEQLHGRHAPRRAARIRGRRQLHHVRVRVLLEVGDLALAGTVVGVVALRRDDPVPAKVLEVDGEGATATALFAAVASALEAAAFGSLFALVPRRDVDEWTLRFLGEKKNEMVWLGFVAWFKLIYGL